MNIDDYAAYKLVKNRIVEILGGTNFMHHYNQLIRGDVVQSWTTDKYYCYMSYNSLIGKYKFTAGSKTLEEKDKIDISISMESLLSMHV